MLKVKDLIHHVKPLCSKCPYKLGLVHTLINPCPQCKKGGYQMFEGFQKQVLNSGLTSEHEKK